MRANASAAATLKTPFSFFIRLRHVHKVENSTRQNVLLSFKLDFVGSRRRKLKCTSGCFFGARDPAIRQELRSRRWPINAHRKALGPS
ncbi:hypothetical protein L596_016006 [Steinernema carpocapsae]|uniref:Uncharacterized protein n=1 Tax=Steinernema carpocapsae TaxID=34508 RepID=A0A4U5NGU1_STECR|nr:hypothetical protein L596_016006 [Steinernema carpocapsae]